MIIRRNVSWAPNHIRRITEELCDIEDFLKIAITRIDFIHSAKGLLGTPV